MRACVIALLALSFTFAHASGVKKHARKPRTTSVINFSNYLSYNQISDLPKATTSQVAFEPTQQRAPASEPTPAPVTPTEVSTAPSPSE